MRSLREGMIDIGLQARFRHMETEELYRGQPTLERLVIIVTRAI